ncbi:hypothetical protein BX616_000760 [Lobosporangium transversale]|uniref:Uncharacterized protein n=1 Tax=Lobosporangium transversale TaxID=64571 RepID=A0A1Y2GI15_9FUNG|nr:hypothetical protein BCR41DRAFT_358324 [Lobosporangium transversale]KAF9906277.1 hypothetical protein BX616_000760 [Lobosporangium transversale]ORZ09695.1 hypothetical protein BCR41DRAFT_358324 [Lobosporangium transversale]|eukprot:XP_021878965.1 hypothetical protein BCR41DRAFT_358324 [Lobosporangium transversale]
MNNSGKSQKPSLGEQTLEIEQDIDALSQANYESSDKLCEPMYAAAQELAKEFNVEFLSAKAVKETQAQIQTVALQIDGVRTEISQIKEQIPTLNRQTKDLMESVDILDQMYRQIDELALLIELVTSSVHEANSRVEEAERELTSVALQPLQAMLESLKMGPKSFRS